VSTGTIIVLVVLAVLVVAAIVTAAATLTRRQQLRKRFGAEYDRLVDDRESKLKAEAELVMRQRHVGQLGIRPLTPALRDRYAADWIAAQEQFVDAPADAVANAQHLVIAALQDCGYPAMHREQVISDLSVDHASTLDEFRAACDISERVSAGTASTEDMRQAMIHYRALFAELLPQPAGAVTGPRHRS
jgi:hypothetical protein